ncbi:hypothetical protein NLU13_5226 [Sarocladium strictum]|uniref:RRM domain-containing protein n=1 Tax=Sarocladium strictum TaxID=5046 RepID=A0AA39L7F0_SARSR|nr:hypothetical protein NLU13_5226 [Sarocladium strictum]
MAPSTRSKTTTVEKTASNGAVAKTAKTVEKKTTKRKAADEGPKPRKQKKAAVAAEEAETEEKPKAQRVPTKASAQRIPKELDPARQDADEEEDEGVLTIVEKLDPEPEDVAAAASTYETGQDVGKIPKSAKKATRAAALAAEEANREKKPGVIYMGRIPHGFYEHEIRQYLEQFGPVLNVRLSRNKKTGASKHYAFVEFEEYSTAETVVKTMDNYLLFGHILKLRMIPEDDVHEDLFKDANKRFKKVPWATMRGKQLEKPQTEQAWEKKVKQERGKRAAKAAKLKALGYDFEAPELKAVPPPTVATVEEAATVEAPEEAKAIEAPAVIAETVVETSTEVVEEVVEKVAVETTPKSTKAKATKKKGKKSKA